mgnify:CR=1 FL=1
MISDELLFLLLNAKIAFFSDILLNILATRNIGFLEKYSFMNSLKTLKPYFENKSPFLAALYALLTVIIIVGIIMKIFQRCLIISMQLLHPQLQAKLQKDWTTQEVLNFAQFGLTLECHLFHCQF